MFVTTNNSFRGILLGGYIGNILGLPNVSKSFDTTKSNKTTFNSNRYSHDMKFTMELASYLTMYPDSYLEYFTKTVREMNKGESRNDSSGAVARISPLTLISYESDIDLFNMINNTIICGNNKNEVDMAFIHVKILISIINRQIKSAESLYAYANTLARLVGNYAILDSLQIIESEMNIKQIRCNIKNIFKYDKSQMNAIDCFICSMICFMNNFDQPEKAIIMAANMGGSTDVIAKLVGELVGAKHGISWIPNKWSNLANKEKLIKLADKLYER
jgi:ADP-ribosylglycohydrolase